MYSIYEMVTQSILDHWIYNVFIFCDKMKSVKNPLIIAHRGSSKNHLDNSWEAFKAARQDGADIIECDINLTKDGYIVIEHDYFIGGILVSDMTLEEARKKKPRIVLLEELLKWAYEKAMPLDIEIKDPACVKPLSKMLKEVKTPEYYVASFHGIALKELKKLNSNIKTALIVATVIDINDVILRAQKYLCDIIKPSWEHKATITVEGVAAMKEKGFKVMIWVANEIEELRCIMGLSPDGIVTDDVQVLKKLIDEA